MTDIDSLFDDDTLLAEPDPELIDAPVQEDDEVVEGEIVDEEPKSRRRASPRAKSAGGRKSKADSLAELKGLLADEAYKFGGIVSPMLPTTGGYMIAEAQEAMDGIVELAKDNPRALEALKQVAKMAPAVVLGRFAVGTATCVLVDMRKIDPDTVPARMLGVTRVWVATHEQEAREKGVYVADPSPVPAFSEL